MKKQNYWKMSAAVAAMLLAGAGFSVNAAELMLDFQLNEGTGLISKSSVGETTLRLGSEIDKAWEPVGAAESPSGKSGDLAAKFGGKGWAHYMLPLGGSFKLDLAKPLAWQGWINARGTAGTAEEFINIGDGAFAVGFKNDANKLSLRIGGVEMLVGDEALIEIPRADNNDLWTHVAFSWNPEYYQDGDGKWIGWLQWWLDGSYAGGIEVSGFRAGAYKSTILTVGGANDGTKVFTGSVDRFRLYNKELSDADIDGEAVNPKPIGNAVYAWDFNEAALPFKAAAGGADLESGLEYLGDITAIQFSDSTPITDVDPTLPEAEGDYSVFVDNRAEVMSGSLAKKYGVFNTDTIPWGGPSEKSFSIEAWFKGVTPAMDKQVFFQTWSSTEGTVPRLSMAIEKDGTIIVTTMAKEDMKTGVPVPQDGGWHHIACAYNQPVGKLTVFVDGKNVGSYQPGNTDVDFTPQSTDVNVGRIGSEHSGWAPFNGYVDRVRLWKGCITEEELDYKVYGEVVVPPSFISTPDNVAVPSGTPVRLVPNIVGTNNDRNPMTFTWFKDGVELAGETNATLEFILDSTTVGTYNLKATNSKGSATMGDVVVSIDEGTWGATKILSFDFPEGQGTTTKDSVNGIVAKIGAATEYPTEVCEIIEDPTGTFPVGDKVLYVPGTVSWLKGTVADEDVNKFDWEQAFTWETWMYLDPEYVPNLTGYMVMGNVKFGEGPNAFLEGTFYGVKDFDCENAYLQLGVWQHVAIAWEPGVGMHFYIDGVYCGLVEDARGPVAATEAFDILVGAQENRPITGMMNRTRFHQGLLTEEGDIENYNYGAKFDLDPSNPMPITENTLISFDFDDTLPAVSNGTVAVAVAECSKEAVDKLNAGNPQWSTDNPLGKKNDYSIEFDGSKSKDLQFDPTPLNVSNKSFTLETWVKLPAGNLAARNVVFAARNASAPGAFNFSFSVNTDRTLWATTYGIADMSTTAKIPDDGEWHHVAFTVKDDDAKVYFYIDGALMATRDNYTSGMNKATSTVGYVGSEGGYYFTGKLKGLHVYDGALSPGKLEYNTIDRSVMPEIESITSDASEATAGTTVTLKVVAKGSKPLSYQWFRNDVAIEGATSDTLEIAQIDIAQAGQYSVEVSNPNGTVKSSKLPVIVLPTAEASKLFEFLFDEGTGTTFTSPDGLTTGVFGRAYDENADVHLVDGVSGIEGDKAAAFSGESRCELITYFDSANAPLDLTKPITWEAWIYLPTAPATYTDFIRMGGSYKVGIDNTGRFVTTFMGVVDMVNTYKVPVGEWVHLASVLDPATGVTMYANGVQVDSWSGTPVGNPFAGGQFSIGSDGGNGSRLTGTVDRLRIHQAALTAAQLDCEAANAKPVTANTVFAYSFDGEEAYANEGSANVDVATSTYKAYVINTEAVAWVPGASNGFVGIPGAENDFALRFDGLSCARFDTTAINFGDIEGDQSFGLEAWVKGYSTTKRQVFLNILGNMEGTCPRLSFSISDKGTIHFTTLGKADVDTGAAIPQDGEWHHLAVSYNHVAGVVAAYVDGVFTSAVAYNKGVDFKAQTTDACGMFGQEVGGGLPFSGSVDRVRIWKGAIAPELMDYPPAPVYGGGGLNIDWVLVDNGLAIRWAVSANANLEAFIDGEWVAVDVVPEIVDGVNQVVVPMTETVGLYRLAK